MPFDRKSCGSATYTRTRFLGGEPMRVRHVCVALCSAALIVTLATGAADAVVPAINQVDGTSGGDKLGGTGRGDMILGRQGDDVITPPTGLDRVRGGKGDDRILVWPDMATDRIYCGPGFDVVVWKGRADSLDVIDVNCEGQIL